MNILLFVVSASALAVVGAKTSKRGISDHDYGHGGASGHLVAGAAGPGGGVVSGDARTTVITNSVPYPVPQPVPVTINQPAPYVVQVPYEVPVDRPYEVAVPQPYTVHVDRPYPILVEKPVPVQVQVPVKVPVAHPVPYEVPQPYTVPYEVPRPYKVEVPYIVHASGAGVGGLESSHLLLGHTSGLGLHHGGLGEKESSFSYFSAIGHGHGPSIHVNHGHGSSYSYINHGHQG